MVQKTSVGLHSRGVISPISVGNTSPLPVGSPSGGVRAGGAAANAVETDVQPGEQEEEEDDFHLRSGKALPEECGDRQSRGEENGELTQRSYLVPKTNTKIKK